jgi:hypothetical protein
MTVRKIDGPRVSKPPAALCGEWGQAAWLAGKTYHAPFVNDVEFDD